MLLLKSSIQFANTKSSYRRLQHERCGPSDRTQRLIPRMGVSGVTRFNQFSIIRSLESWEEIEYTIPKLNILHPSIPSIFDIMIYYKVKYFESADTFYDVSVLLYNL